MKLPYSFRALLIIWAALYGSATYSQTNEFGVSGVLDVPTARVQQEGSLATTISLRDVVDIYSISYQALPRMEASFRYSISFDRVKNPVSGSFCEQEFLFCAKQLKDRSFELKFLVLEEHASVPAVAVGIRDILGTGVYNGEYVVASKTLGNWDISVGLGWGRLAERSVSRNPLGLISSRFDRRVESSSLGGNFSLGSYFRGETVGIFGSLAYTIPRYRLKLLAAFNSDSYAREREQGLIRGIDPVNFGMEWDLSQGLALGVNWQGLDRVGIRVTARLDTASLAMRRPPNRFSANTRSATVRLNPPDSNGGEVGWWPRFVQDAEASGLLVPEAVQRGEELLIQYRNSDYQLEADAVLRIMSLADLYAPAETTRFTAIGTSLGLTTHSVTALRGDRQELNVSGPVELPAGTETRFETRYAYPNGKISPSIGLRTYLFDPDYPFLWQAFARLRGDVDFGGGWSATGSWVESFSSQFDRITRKSESALPKVRTLAVDYLQQGSSGIDDLALIKRGKLAPDVYYQAFGGLLEEMYAGVGGEVLWRPVGSRLAFGANIIAVRQRDFDKDFGLRDYRVVTGHLSAYWASPFYNFDVIVHAGRYLAGDVGATLEIQKRYANGWSIGAFATLTDVPFSVFGEGSFDKGLIFRIPFDPFSSVNVRGQYRAIIRPINRDGGRMVDNLPGRLWENMRDTTSDRLRLVPSRR